MRILWLAPLGALLLLACSVQDPISDQERLDASMLTCADLPRDTVFLLTERYVSGHLDTTTLWKKGLDSTRAPRFDGDMWYLREVHCVSGCIQIILKAPEPPVTGLDSARLRQQNRQDSLTRVCDGSQMDTLFQTPLNHPLPTQSLYKVLAHMLDTAHGDTLRTTLPAGFGFALFGKEQGIRLVQGQLRRSVSDTVQWPFESTVTNLTASFDTTEYPKQVRPSSDSLLVPLLPQEPWGLRIWDAYGFEDSLVFNPLGGYEN